MLWCLVVVADCGVDLLDWLLIVRFSGVLLGSCCVFSLLLCWCWFVVSLWVIVVAYCGLGGLLGCDL